MKRTTISIPDELGAFLKREVRRQDTSVSELVRQALTAHFHMGQPRKIPFAGIGRSGKHDIAERFEEYLAEDGFSSTEKLSIAVVDSGPLYAALDADDSWHESSLRALGRADLELVIPAMVIAEVSYVIQRRLGPRVEAGFLRGCSDFEIVAPTSGDLVRMAELVERYGDFPLGATDASVIALAEGLGTELVMTTDRRHFLAVRPLHCDQFTLLPE